MTLQPPCSYAPSCLVPGPYRCIAADGVPRHRPPVGQRHPPCSEASKQQARPPELCPSCHHVVSLEPPQRHLVPPAQLHRASMGAMEPAGHLNHALSMFPFHAMTPKPKYHTTEHSSLELCACSPSHRDCPSLALGVPPPAPPCIGHEDSHPVPHSQVILLDVNVRLPVPMLPARFHSPPVP